MNSNRLTWVVGFALIGSCGCYHFHGGQQARIDFHQVAPVQDVSTVVIETRNGSIGVRCMPGASQAEISGTKHAQGVTLAEAQAAAERIEIRVERPAGQPGKLRIAAEFPPGVNGGVTFDVVLPDSVVLDLSTHNASVTVTGARRDVHATSTNGAIKATGITGKVTARTSNGSVTLEDVAGDVDASSSNGRILFKRVGQTRVIADTSNGSIEAHATRGNVQLTSSNGRIVWKPESLPDKPDVRISTNNASVRAEVPADAHAAVRLNTSNASVHASLSGAQVGDLRNDRGSLHAVLNGGGGQIEVRTANGGIDFDLFAPQAADRQGPILEAEVPQTKPALKQDKR